MTSRTMPFYHRVDRSGELPFITAGIYRPTPLFSRIAFGAALSERAADLNRRSPLRACSIEALMTMV